ncbi:MAG: glycosyltransferase family 4 protein [Nitrospiraceae bacterium]|nr:glycosyltransferase family 4 protein [Nitrospiraceae bacterium]
MMQKVASRAVAPEAFSEERRGQGARPRMVRVCFVSPLGYGLYHPESGLPFGGAEVQIFLTSGVLAKDTGFHTSVLTTVDREPATEQLGALTLITRRGQGRLSGRTGLLAALRGYWSSFREMWDLFQRINADVYVHAGAGVEVGAYALICRFLHRRFVFVVASNADLTDRYGLVRGPLARLYPLGVRLADEVVCRTEDQRELLRRRFGREGLLIRSGHPIPMQGDRSRQSMLWVGRIHPVKQPLVFLDLAARCPDIRFTMVGMRDPLEPTLWDAVRTRVAQLSNVVFLPNQSLAEVEETFQAATLLINTSQYEGFPNTYIQAAASGVPIVSLTVDPDHVLAQHRIGRCAGGDFDAMVEAVKRFGRDERLREDYARRARVYAIGNHSLEVAVSRWKDTLLTLAGQAQVELLREAA